LLHALMVHEVSIGVTQGLL